MNGPTQLDLSNIPIIVMSFNRPNYLEEVLKTLKDQLDVDWSTRRVALFQDNVVNKYSGRRHGDESDISDCVKVFRKVFPRGEVHLSEVNLGVCENFLRAETWAFKKLNAEFAYFFEDDMILSPYYIRTMNQLAAIAAADDRIGYFSAHGNHNLTLNDQIASKSKLIRLGHHWAFGIRKSHWVDLQVWLKPYFDMVVGRDYRERPTKDILEYFRSKGTPLGVSSQDDVKKVGTYMLGRCSLNTTAVFARYIGATGLHMSKEKFEKHGYANTVLFQGEVKEFEKPNHDQINDYIRKELDVRWKNILKTQAQSPSPTKDRTASKAVASPSANAAIELGRVPNGIESETAEDGPSYNFRQILEASSYRVKIGPEQKGFARTSARNFVKPEIQRLFEFVPLTEAFIQNQICTLDDPEALALLRKIYLSSDDTTKITLHELDPSDKTAERTRLEREGSFVGRSLAELSALLTSAGFDIVTRHQIKSANGEVSSTLDMSLSALVNPRGLPAVGGIVISGIKQRKSAPDFFNHSYTIKTRECVDENFAPMPWMTYPAVEYLKQFDYSGKKIFEYGSGNSTVFWSKRCAAVVSVEHNKKWHDIVKGWNIPRSKLIFADEREQYVNAIQGQGEFDVLVIDGQWRDVCAENALQFLAPKGLLILDNSERYPKVTRKFRDADLIQVDFFGHSPLNRAMSVTSMFLRRDFALKPIMDRAPNDRWGLHDAQGRPKKL